MMRQQRFVLALLVVAQSVWAEPLTLPQLIERARANDHRVKEAQAQLRVFQAKYEEAKWAWFPRIDSTFLVSGPMPEARNDGLGGPPTTKPTLMYDLDFGQPGVMLRADAQGFMPLYTFGKLTALEQAGKKGVEAGESLAVAAADEAEFQVSQAYYAYCLAQSGREVLADTMKRLDDAKAAIEKLRRLNSDQVTQMDVYKVDYYRQQVEVQRSTVDAGAGFALAAIRLLIAAPDASLEVSPIKLETLDGELLPVDAYVAQAAVHRPELRAIAAGLAAREQEVFIRERMYFPDFGIAGFFRWMWTTSSTRQLSPFAYDPYNDLSAGIGLVMRYQWDIPQKNAQLEQSRGELDKLTHQRDLLVAGVRLQIEKAWLETTAAMTRAARQAQAEKNARRWATSAFAGFDVGTSDTRELVDSFTALAASSAQRAQAAYEAYVGLKAIGRAIGAPAELAPSKAEAPPPVLAPK